MNSQINLFSPIQLGCYELSNRIVMAPMTRLRAIGSIPNQLMATYYAQRITNGGYNKSKGNAILATGDADLVSFARLFIANPDLPERLANNAPLNTPDSTTFCPINETELDQGYTDYPFLESTYCQN